MAILSIAIVYMICPPTFQQIIFSRRFGCHLRQGGRLIRDSCPLYTRQFTHVCTLLKGYFLVIFLLFFFMWNSVLFSFFRISELPPREKVNWIRSCRRIVRLGIHSSQKGCHLFSIRVILIATSLDRPTKPD